MALRYTTTGALSIVTALLFAIDTRHTVFHDKDGMINRAREKGFESALQEISHTPPRNATIFDREILSRDTV
jgi:hypothetical protein